MSQQTQCLTIFSQCHIAVDTSNNKSPFPLFAVGFYKALAIIQGNPNGGENFRQNHFQRALLLEPRRGNRLNDFDVK